MIFVAALLLLAFVSLARAEPPAPAAAELRQERIDSIREKTLYHRARADFYAHKMARHLPAAHGQLRPLSGVSFAEQRLRSWFRLHRKTQAQYKAWRFAQMCKRPRPLLSPQLTVKHKRASLHQRKVLTEALNVAHQRRLIRVKTYTALVAGITQEATANNKPRGHGTSVGVLQLINSHGSVKWRLHIPNSVNWFLNGVIPDDRRNPRLPLTVLIQNQQGSGHPDAYAQWGSEARRTVRLFLGPCYRLARA